ncbi:MAG: hypothetical protein QM813_03215 [Verrucomicrobiota bacterium]
MKPGAKLIERFHALPEISRKDKALRSTYEWLLVPLSMWPVDLIGLMEHLLEAFEGGRKPSEDIIRLVNLIGDAPTEKTCSVISEHEHNVKGGDYETLIKAQHKFDFKEEVLLQYKEFREEWKWIKSQFDLNDYQGENGVIRRRMVSERNFRPPEWNFRWDSDRDRFRNIFDAFCHKWVLYGMEKDKPLLQKLSVNVTPFGTMIFIPRYWSFDRNRDLKWRAITRLHRARGVPRQGAKLSANQAERRRQADVARGLIKMATEQGMKGERRDYWVMAKLGLHPDTHPKQLHRLLKMT